MKPLATVRLTTTPRWLSLLWEPRDCWIGVYWTTTRGQWCLAHGTTVWQWDSEWHGYLCLVPCFPLHLRWPRAASMSEDDPIGDEERDHEKKDFV